MRRHGVCRTARLVKSPAYVKEFTMQYADDHNHRVQIDTQDCNIPQDELVRMQSLLGAVPEALTPGSSALPRYPCDRRNL